MAAVAKATVSLHLDTTGIVEQLRQLAFAIEGVTPEYNERTPDELTTDGAANDCNHSAASGVDQTAIIDPHKVWRCDHCGLRWTSNDGIAVAVPNGAQIVIDASRLTWDRRVPTAAELTEWIETKTPAGEFSTGLLIVADALRAREAGR